MRTLLLSSLLVLALPAFAGEGQAKPLDINAASRGELKTLPGVTDAIAGKIVAGRPYTGKEQLVEQKIVAAGEYARIRPLIVARQPKAIGGKGAVERHETPDATGTSTKR